MGYGQYSNALHASERMTISELVPMGAVDWHKPKTCTGHNRLVVSYPDESIAFRFRCTDVVTLHKDGRLEFRDGGWKTITTRQAMMQGVQELTGFHWGVYSAGSRSEHDHTLVVVLDGARVAEIDFTCPFTYQL